MRPHPKTGRTIREDAEVVAHDVLASPDLLRPLTEPLVASMIERAILRYAAPKYTRNGNGNGHAKEEPDYRRAQFLLWFQETYQAERGTAYVPSFPRDMAIITRLLKSVSLNELQDCARILLGHHTDDRFIQESDRGIGILSVKFNWLNGRRAALLARLADPLRGVRL